MLLFCSENVMIENRSGKLHVDCYLQMHHVMWYYKGKWVEGRK